VIVNEFHAAGDTQGGYQGSSSGRRWPTPSEGPSRLGCIRQIIFKILRHLIFKMTDDSAD